MYVGLQIRRARDQTLTSNGGSEAIEDRNFLAYFNDAISRIFSLVSSQNQSFWEVEEEISIVGGQARYTPSGDIYLGDRVVKVEYSYSGIAEDYKLIEFVESVERRNYKSCPFFYGVSGGDIVLSPEPQSENGKIRVTYIRRPDRVDLRRGVVLSNNDTTITLDGSGSPVPDSELENADYICVVDKFGLVLNYALPVTSYVSGVITGTFTELTFPEGSYVVIGKYASSHCGLPGEWSERYLNQYVVRQLMGSELSNTDISNQNDMLAALELEIVETVEASKKRYQGVPLTNSYFV